MFFFSYLSRVCPLKHVYSFSFLFNKYLAAARNPKAIIISHPLMLRLQMRRPCNIYIKTEELSRSLRKSKKDIKKKYQMERASMAT